MEFFNKLEIIYQYSHLALIVLLLAVLILIVMVWRQRKGIDAIYTLVDKKHKDTVLAIEVSETDMRDRLTKISHGFGPTADAMRKRVQEDMRELADAIDESFTRLRAELEALQKTVQQLGGSSQAADQLAKLLEQQGVFLHDRFNELTAGEDKRTDNIRRLLTEQTDRQTAESDRQAAQMDALRENITVQLSGQAERQSAESDKQAAQMDALRENITVQLSGQTERQSAESDKQAAQMDALREKIAVQLTELIQKERELQQAAHSEATALMSESINRLAGEVDAKLSMITDKVSQRFNENLADTLQSFASLQQEIGNLIAAKEELSMMGQDISSLTRLVLSKGSDGDLLQNSLPDMLAAILPEESYTLAAPINGQTAAAQLRLPGDQGAVVIDDSIALDSFKQVISPDISQAERDAARQQFAETLHTHINDVADRFIAPPQTANSALLFIPSETAFAEIQAHHKDLVNHALQRHVWLLSPTTLAVALNMARQAIKNQQAREQLQHVHQALQGIMQEAHTFEARLVEIGDHVNNAMRSVQRAESAGSKLFGDVRGAARLTEGSPALTDQPPPSS